MDIMEYDSLLKCSDIIKDFQKKEPVNLFFTYEWMSLWKRYFAQEDKEMILVFREGNNVIGYMPLVYKERRIKLLTVYRYYGTKKSNYMHLPVKAGRAAEVYDRAFEFFRQVKGGAILRIDNINNSSEDYLVLSEKKGGLKYLLHQSPYTMIGDSWDSFFSKHITKSKRRSKLRSFESKLGRVGEVSFIRINNYDSYMEYKELLEQTFFIHRLRFRDVINSSMYSNGRFSDFYRNVFREFSILGILDMSLICIDNIVVSFILALKQDKTLIHYVPGFHIAFKCFSLGHLHLMKLFQKLTDEQQIKCFDFSLGSQEYKERWADDTSSNYSFLFRFGGSPLVWLNAFFMNLVTVMKLFGRERGWNAKIKKLLGQVRRKKDSLSMKDGIEDGIGDGQVIPCPAASIYQSVEIDYSFTELMTLPLNVQIFVIEELYKGKMIKFLVDENRIVGIKVKDEEGDKFLQIG